MAINNTDFINAFKAIKKKRPVLDLLYRYVNGGQPLRYSTERLEEAFSDLRTRFEINWCSVIVNTSLDRLQLTGFDTDDQAANDALDTVFDQLHIDLEADKAHKGALSMESAYIIVWKTEQNEIEIYYNDPRNCHVFYESSNPHKRRYGAKWFRRDDDRHEITLYYPQKIEHYISKSTREEISNPNDFELESSETNTFGAIPVFELKTEGEIDKVTTLQDAINKTFADMMVAAEYGAFVQRWVVSNSDPGDLKNGPNEIWWIPSGDGIGQASSVGQFTPTALSGYLDAMDKLANSMAIITRTPKHYLMTTGANISGEALLAMETPLTRKAEKHQRRFTAVWQDIGAFILRLLGKQTAPSDITVTWDRVESIQPFTEAQTNQILINTGIPLETILRRAGWTESEIQQLNDDRTAERTRSRTLAQETLASLRNTDAQSNVAPAATTPTQ